MTSTHVLAIFLAIAVVIAILYIINREREKDEGSTLYNPETWKNPPAAPEGAYVQETVIVETVAPVQVPAPALDSYAAAELVGVVNYTAPVTDEYAPANEVVPAPKVRKKRVMKAKNPPTPVPSPDPVKAEKKPRRRADKKAAQAVAAKTK